PQTRTARPRGLSIARSRTESSRGEIGAPPPAFRRPRAVSRHPDLATILEVMPSYRDILRDVRAEIDEVDGPGAHERLGTDTLFVDVRERDEWDEGRIPGAIHIPRGNLESRIEQAVPDRAQPLVLYCSAG